MLMFSDVGGSGQWQWKVSRAEIRLGAILIFENQMIINCSLAHCTGLVVMVWLVNVGRFIIIKIVRFVTTARDSLHLSDHQLP